MLVMRSRVRRTVGPHTRYAGQPPLTRRHTERRAYTGYTGHSSVWLACHGHTGQSPPHPPHRTTPDMPYPLLNFPKFE